MVLFSLLIQLVIMSPLRGLIIWKAAYYNHDVPTALFFNPGGSSKL
jgi:hypothetical protein